MQNEQFKVEETSDNEIISDDTENSLDDIDFEENEVEQEASSDVEETTSEKRELIGGQFENPEQLLQSYREIQAMATRQAQELAQIRKQAQQKSEYVVPQTVEELREALKKDPIGTLKNIAIGATKEEVQQEVRQVRFEQAYAAKLADPDFKSLDPVMVQIAEEYQDLIPPNLANDPKILDILYLAAKGRVSAQAVKQAENTGVTRGEQMAKRKIKSQVEGPSGSKGVTKRNFEELTLEEMEKVLLRQKG